MNAEVFNGIREAVRKTQPLIHCITNPIAITQSANALLAIGARPMMAEHPKEVAEITETAGALLLNLGNITDVRMESMLLAAKAAQKHGVPATLDLVGIACSSLRRDYADTLLQAVNPAVIKGNYAELAALYDRTFRSSGVDADSSLSEENAVSAAVSLARQYRTTVLASGKCDIVTDGERIFRITNGTAQLASVTGTGCMLGALCAAFTAAASPLEAAAVSCAVLGICGELAETEEGSGSFFIRLMDALSTLKDETLTELLKTEEETLVF